MENNKIMGNDNFETIRQKVYLAALLHDIGKFYQRADNNNTKDSRILSEQTKNLESVYCPKFKGKYSHKHVLWTAQFFEDFDKTFKDLSYQDDTQISVFRLATAHHRPDENSLYEKLIQKADWYSSGVDRNKDEYSINDGLLENDWEAYKKKRLLSIFEGIGSNGIEYNYLCPVSALNLTNTFFPKKTSEFSLPPDYNGLWNDFIKEFSQINTNNYKVFSETTLNLLYKYTVTIPSSTIHLPDVSLFDHLKTTASFAVCLLDYLNDKKIETIKSGELKSENPFVLIGGDLSGIQDFIYDIISKNAAKNLKGRSFYIKLLTDSITQKILSKLNLFKANLIYDAGGNFYILAPNTEETLTNLKNLEVLFTEELFKAHGTTIFLSLDYTCFGEKELLDGDIADVWEKLQYKIDKKKQQRYKDKIIKSFDEFFTPIDIGGKQQRDSITGEEITDKEKESDQLVYIDDKKDLAIKSVTYKQIELGKQLKKSDLWVKSDEQLSYWGDEKEINPANLGVYYYFISKDDLNKYAKELKSSADKVEIISVNDSGSNTDGEIEFLQSLKGMNNIYGFDFYGGNTFPAYEADETDESGNIHKTGEPKTFDKLCGSADFKRLGVLKMDVDNLGQLFANGFKGKKRTFSRLLALSRNLDYFFKGYINTIWKQDKYRNETIILYSGGDDLFIVGKWDKALSIAQEIHKLFSDFTCHNQSLSISGGMAVVGAKYPILKGADQATESEHIAKNYKNREHEKNAFCLLEHPLNWKIEYSVVEELKNKIIDYIGKNQGLPKAFIGNIHKFATNRKLQIDKGRNESWQWQMAYSLARMAKRIKDSEIRGFIDQIKTDVFADTWHGKSHNFKYHMLDLINVASRWAELENRSKTEDI